MSHGVDSAPRELSVPIGQRRITLREPPGGQAEEEERLSLWWGVTTAAAVLAAAIDSGPPLQGSRVIELGCGLGLAGIAAALCGGHVTFTDGVAAALEHARGNAELNRLAPEQTAFRLLRWDEPPADLGPADLILGSEIAYDYFFHDELLRLLDGLCKPAGTILLADRPRLVIERFLGRLTARGFRCTEQLPPALPAMLPPQDVRVYRLRRC